MWSIVYKWKLNSKRLIHQKDHEKVEICKLLKDRGLSSTVSMAKPFNWDIVLEFYANLKSNIFDVYAFQFHKVMWGLPFLFLSQFD